MSYTWMLVRGGSANPSSLKFQALMNKQSIAENEVFKPERQQPNIISVHMEDSVLLQDPFFFTKLKQKTIKFYGPWEPDGVLLKYWCKFNHIARQIKDHSFSGNYTYPVGNPKLCAGPDDGIKGGTILTRINSNPDIIDYFYTPDAPGIRVSEATNGFSIYLEFVAESLAKHGSRDPSIMFKVDDSTPNNGVLVRIRADDESNAGAFNFIVLKSGTQYSFETPANAITLGQLYRCCLTYNPTGNIQTMRINNIPQTDASSSTVSFPAAHRLDLFHGIRNSQNSGRFVGRLRDSRWYNFVLTSGQQDNIWNNGRSISPIEFGSLAVAGYSRFNDTPDPTAGYDSTGYDSTGYDTT